MARQLEPRGSLIIARCCCCRRLSWQETEMIDAAELVVANDEQQDACLGDDAGWNLWDARKPGLPHAKSIT